MIPQYVAFYRLMEKEGRMLFRSGVIIAILISICVAEDAKWWEEESSAQAALEERSMGADYKGRINWEDGYIEVTAGGTCNMEKAQSQAHCKSMALKTARMLALEKLAEIIYGVRIDSDNLFVNEVEEDVRLKSETSGLIQGARELALEETVFDDGSIWVESTIGITLNGGKGLSSVVVPWMQRKIQSSPPSLFTASKISNEDDSGATGLIVDGSGLSLKPALAPRILVQGKDEELYGRVTIDRQAAIKFGVVGYTDSVEKARALTERVGAHPLLVPALETAGTHGSDVVISVDDGARILSADMKNGFMKECRVVFVIG